MIPPREMWSESRGLTTVEFHVAFGIHCCRFYVCTVTVKHQTPRIVAVHETSIFDLGTLAVALGYLAFVPVSQEEARAEAY